MCMLVTMYINVERTPVYFPSKVSQIEDPLGSEIGLLHFAIRYTTWKHLHATCGKQVVRSFQMYVHYTSMQILVFTK